MNIFDYDFVKEPQSLYKTNPLDSPSEEEKSWEIVEGLISSFSLSPKKQYNHKVFMRAIALIVEMKNEGILDEDEAKSLLQFIASKFVENSLDSIFELAFERDYSKSRSLKEIMGRFKHE